MEPGPLEQTQEEIFDTFLYTDQTVAQTLELFERLKDGLQLHGVPHHLFFSRLKEHFKSWRVTSFMEILQRRLNVKEYASSVAACKDCNILVIGAGPCGLRFAIEAALCGARVVLVEKRNSFTRNNVLHLWPYLIHDLRNIGIKKLFGKFCAGSLDHISIRRLQLILLKISLVLGVRVYTNTSYIEHLEPCSSTGWRVSVKPSVTEIETIDFDVLVGADGKRNSIPGFQRKEFRAKLAIGITANFVNKNTDEEAKIEEISGVAALFNQKFFADLKTETDIDLENIVYYRDDTHYFVMTAKKSCLLKKGVLKEDHGDVIKLLSYNNVDNSQLLHFVHQAAEFSAGLPHNEVALDPDNGKEDVAIFDFTSMYSAEYAAKIMERRGRRLLIGLVGDGLMEPFWPLGTGCARGFLSSMDFMWMVVRHQQGVAPIDLLEERMALYKLLHQTTNENMHKKHSTYTMNPRTRYKIIHPFKEDVSYLYVNEEKENKRAQRPEKFTPEKTSPGKRKLAGETTETVHKQWKKSTFARTRKPKNPSVEPVLRQKRSITPEPKRGSGNDQETLLKWCQEMLKPIYPYLPITDLDTCWRDGVLLCGLVHLCSPKDIDLNIVKMNSDAENVDLVIAVMFHELGIQSLTSDDVLPPSGPDLLAIITTIMELKRVYETMHDTALTPISKKTRLVPTTLKLGSSATPVPVPDATPKADTPMEVETPLPAPGSLKKRVHSQRKLRKKTESKFIAQVDNVAAETKVGTPSKGSKKCHTCALSVLVIKRVAVEGYVFHRKCFVCEDCGTSLKTSTYHLITSNDPTVPGRFYCKKHFTEIVGRSRELTRSKEEVTPRKSGRKSAPRPQSMCLESPAKKNKSFRPTTPVVMETAEDEGDVSAPPTKHSKSAFDNLQNRYRDTSLEIHLSSKSPRSSSPRSSSPQAAQVVTRSKSPEVRAKSPEGRAKVPVKPSRTAGKVTITQPRETYRGKVETRSPSPARDDVRVKKTRSPSPTRVTAKKQRSPDQGKQEGIAKKLTYHEELPIEQLPDNYGPTTATSPHLKNPAKVGDSSNVTTRRKSKKNKKAPAPPEKEQKEASSSSSKHAPSKHQFKKYNENSRNYIADDDGTTARLISQSAVSLSPSPSSASRHHDNASRHHDNASPSKQFAYSRSKTESGKQGKPIAAGVKGRVVKDALHGNRMTSRAEPKGLTNADTSVRATKGQTSDSDASVSTTTSSRSAHLKPAINRHTRAGSMTDLDNYLPRHSKKMSTKYGRKDDKEEGKPVSVKDRVAMYHQNDLSTSASFSAGEKKRIEVSPDLKKAVSRDGDRIIAKRTTVETDGSPASFSRGTPVRRKRLRLKPTNKQNQRRLAQAQTIQRDRSLLEQKMAEFENHAALIEQQLRNSGNDDKALLSQFLELVNIKNELTRRENELHLCEKYLQLLDEQDQIERDLRYLLETNDADKTADHREEEEEMILKKFDVVNRRDYLLMQLDESKRREEEENEQINAMLSEKGMFSNQHNYNTESFITIEALLEAGSEDEGDDDVEDTLAIFEQSTAQVQRRPKKTRNGTDDNVLSRFFNRLSLFG